MSISPEEIQSQRNKRINHNVVNVELGWENNMNKLTEDDIGIGHVQDGFNVRFVSLEGEDIVWTEKQANELKKQILSNQEKAEKYDRLMKANSEVVQQNISLTQLHEENKQLREKL